MTASVTIWYANNRTQEDQESFSTLHTEVIIYANLSNKNTITTNNEFSIDDTWNDIVDDDFSSVIEPYGIETYHIQ